MHMLALDLSVKSNRAEINTDYTIMLKKNLKNCISHRQHEFIGSTSFGGSIVKVQFLRAIL